METRHVGTSTGAGAQTRHLTLAGPRRRRGQAAVGLGRQHGWTLVELLVVMVLIVILAGIALAGYRNSVTRAKEVVLREDLFRMRDAIDQYYTDKQKYPPSLEELVTEGYLRKVPEDPLTGSTATWQTVMAEPDTANPSAEPGIFDVKSGSEATAIDGSRYSDW